MLPYKEYLKANDITDENETKYLTYLDFKNWLYDNFPQFIDQEYTTDHWKYSKNKRTVEVYISTYWVDVNNHEPHEQYISVGFENRNGEVSGWGRPCDTLEEVKRALNQALEKMGEKKRIGADYYDNETYAAFEQTTLHPTYQEIGKCFFDRDLKKCNILERIGSYDARCKGCPNTFMERKEQLSLF